MNTKQIIQKYNRYVMPCYKRASNAFTKGSAENLWSPEGEKYIDFFSGWAVSGVGHCNSRVSSAIKQQAARLIHLPNNYYQEAQASLAEVIVKNSFKGKVFFCNSGAEAIEGAIKLARVYGNDKRNEIITMERSFHGRTFGAMSATGQNKFYKGLRPILSGFKKVPFNDIKVLKKTITKKTVGILLELVQGEGGVRVASKSYVKEVARLCKAKDILLIVDEVQTGMGRTGKMFAFQHYGITPDIMLLAKSLGGGFPIGAIVGGRKVSDTFQPGVHASTFGGNPLACAAAKAVFNTIKKDKLIFNATKMGDHLVSQLNLLKKKYKVIKEVRGVGLMVAVELNGEGQKIVDFCMNRKVLINVTQLNVLRFAPPLTIKKKTIKKVVQVLDEALSEY